MDIGTLDKRVLIEAKVPTRDAIYNTELSDWVPHATVWASVLDVLNGKAEATTVGVRLLTRPCRVRMRYLSSINAQMRITVFDDGRVMQIVNLAEIGRREGLQLLCEEYSS